MIACATDIVGALWFWVLVLAIVALPVAALAHVNGEHTQRRRERQARQHPCSEPRHVRIVEVPALTAPQAREALATALGSDGPTRLIDQEAEGW